MKGKDLFTQEEIEELRRLVSNFQRATSAQERKSIRTRLRKLNFYVSDFGIENIDLRTFEALLKSKRIGVTRTKSLVPEKKSVIQRTSLPSAFSSSIREPEVGQLELEKKLLQGKFISAGNLSAGTDLDSTGFYAIRLKSGSRFPSRYQIHLEQRQHLLIYIGKAENQSLRKRFLGQELRARGHGTFFRSIGAVLGYTPQKGSLVDYRNKKNYKFAPLDEAAIIRWINENLEVNWIAYSGDFEIEKILIQKYCPLLNHSHNPKRLSELMEDKSRCRLIACQI